MGMYLQCIGQTEGIIADGINAPDEADDGIERLTKSSPVLPAADAEPGCHFGILQRLDCAQCGCQGLTSSSTHHGPRRVPRHAVCI